MVKNTKYQGKTDRRTDKLVHRHICDGFCLRKRKREIQAERNRIKRRFGSLLTSLVSETLYIFINKSLYQFFTKIPNDHECSCICIDVHLFPAKLKIYWLYFWHIIQYTDPSRWSCIRIPVDGPVSGSQ